MPDRAQPRVIEPDESQERLLRAEGCFVLQAWGLPEDAGLSVARARVAPGERTAWHCLEGVREIYLLAEGRGRVEVGSLGPREVGPGALVVIPPGVRQRIENAGSEDLVFYCICTPAFADGCYRALEGA
ncbi:MAG: cupin domain-containing protein [Deltaproteobacteria bacterium]|nr:cupin domain-containing protein [Deltaproteobacteria bacterium]